jgi:PKD repeat protein
MKTRQLALLLLATSVTLLVGCVQNVHPVAVISADRLQGYPPLNISFDAASSQGAAAPIVSYHWDFGDGVTAGASTASHSFEDKGTYSVILTVTDADGLIGSTAKTIQVLNRVPHADFRISPFGAPRDYPVQFDASESNDPDGVIVTYIWDFGDGESDEGMNVEHIFPQQQTEYLVTLTVIDDSGATNSSMRKVVVLGCDTCG